MSLDLAAVRAGDVHEERVEVGAERVRAFADATGDHNPVHLDAAYAATTRFGRPIAHGALLLGLVSRVLATRFPGPGTIYLSQEARFLRPVHVGETVTVRLTVGSVDVPRRRLGLATTVLDSSGGACVEGRAEVFAP